MSPQNQVQTLFGVALSHMQHICLTGMCFHLLETVRLVWARGGATVDRARGGPNLNNDCFCIDIINTSMLMYLQSINSGKQYTDKQKGVHAVTFLSMSSTRPLAHRGLSRQWPAQFTQGLNQTLDRLCTMGYPSRSCPKRFRVIVNHLWMSSSSSVGSNETHYCNSWTKVVRSLGEVHWRPADR